MNEIKMTDIMEDPVIKKMKRYVDITNGNRSPDHRYTMLLSELSMLSMLSNVSTTDAICLAFEYGKAKGERWARNRLIG